MISPIIRGFHYISFAYNAASTWAYSTVIMTYFGVNYYLSGLHSYATGDPVPIPMWVYYGIAGLFVLTVLAARKSKIKYIYIIISYLT